MNGHSILNRKRNPKAENIIQQKLKINKFKSQNRLSGNSIKRKPNSTGNGNKLIGKNGQPDV